MPSKSFQWVIGGLVLAAAVAPAVFLRVEHVQLERRLARQREFTAHSRQITEENRSLQDLVAKTSGDTMAATAVVHTELEAARRELAELEKRAREQRKEVTAQATWDADALANNRDPLRGLTRPEYFTDAGQATPAAAFQTLGWATLHQPERVAALLTLSPAARTKADELIAALPEEARAKWTPDKLGALWLTGAMTNASAFQIADVRMDGANTATVVLRVVPAPRQEPKLRMELGPNGWRVLVDERGIDVVRRMMSQANR